MQPKSTNSLFDALVACSEQALSGRSAEAFPVARQLYERARRQRSQRGMAAALSILAQCCIHLGHGDAGLDCAVAAQRLWTRLNNPAEAARAVAMQALLLLDVGLSDESFEIAVAAVELAQAAGDPAILAYALNTKACALALCRQLDSAIDLLKETMTVAVAAGDDRGVALYTHNLAYCYGGKADEAALREDSAVERYWLDQTVETAEEAIRLAEASGEYWVMRAGLHNSAEYMARIGDMAGAWRNLERSQSAPGEPGPSLTIHYLYTLGEVSMRSGDLVAAAAALNEAMELAEANQQIDHLLNCAGRLADLAAAQGDFKTAYERQKRFHAIYVRQSGETTVRQARVAEARYQAEQWRQRANRFADDAMRDSLTGVANRRWFDAAYEGMERTGFALAILDLDHFKTVNDRFSHIVGDEVLRQIATCLESELGEAGQLARLGGEEFVVLFAGLDMTTAAAVCERMRRAVEQAPWGDIAEGLSVTTSIGLAVNEIGGNGAELLAIADRRLYAAKAGGRNRLVATDVVVRRDRWHQA